MPEPTVTIRDILGFLRRQSRVIATTTLAILLLATAAVSLVTPSYRATALVLVDPSRKNLLDPNAQAPSSAGDSARVDSEVEILRSDTILLDVVNSLGLAGDPEFDERPGLPGRVLSLLGIRSADAASVDERGAAVLDRVRASLSIDRRGLTYLIAVDVTSRDAAKAARIANAAADAYIARQVEAKVAGSIAARDAMQGQLAQARQKIVAAETALSGFVADNLDAIVSASGRADLVDLRARLASVTADRRTNIQQAQSLRQGMTLADFTAFAAETQARLAALEAAIAANDAEAAGLRKRLNAEILSADIPADYLAQLYGLSHAARIAAAQYQTMLSRTQDLEAQSELQVADSRVVSPALDPTRPSFPNVPLVLGLAGLLALGSGIGAGLLNESLTGGFISQDSVEARTRRPLGAVLPRQKPTGGAKSLADAPVEAPLSRYAEGLRRLRAAIDRAARKNDDPDGARRGRVIMVSSARTADGKTTIALSLARTYALAGQRTVVVDCDFRKPDVHRLLGCQPMLGLVDLLSGEMTARDFAEIVMTDTKTPLTAILGAHRSDLPTDQLVTRQSFTRLIEALGRDFDTIVMDTPPIEPVVDGVYLATFADVIVFAIGWARTPQRAVVAALDDLAASKNHDTPIITVLNRVDQRGAGYGSGSY